MPKALEGLWDELIARHPELRGRRVRVTVIDEKRRRKSKRRLTLRRVRVTVIDEVQSPDEALPIGSPERVFQVLERIHLQMRAMGHIPPTDEDAMERIEAERRLWDE
jgi:glycerol-3-phosphate cytidylyltransferase-like family protein